MTGADENRCGDRFGVRHLPGNLQHDLRDRAGAEPRNSTASTGE